MWNRKVESVFRMYARLRDRERGKESLRFALKMWPTLMVDEGQENDKKNLHKLLFYLTLVVLDDKIQVRSRERINYWEIKIQCINVYRNFSRRICTPHKLFKWVTHVMKHLVCNSSHLKCVLMVGTNRETACCLPEM